MKVTVVGGGPAGLYFAYLLKRQEPRHEILVLERNPADATFGFGVVLADGGLRNLEAADQPSYQRLEAALHWNSRQLFTVNGESAPIDRSRQGGAIERLKLLGILQNLCAEAGVVLRFQHSVEDVAALDADLVVGADGRNSLVRGAFEGAFGIEETALTNRFAWYGVEREFPTSHLNFKSIPGGALVGHYYPYAPGRSTFVMECDAAGWTGAGLDRMSDEERRLFAQGFFAEELDGKALISNNSAWRQFIVIATRRWHHQRYVLLGDAQYTAHFSIGSGTRLAFEDAIALTAALGAGGPLDAALPRYEAARRPQKEKLASAAQRSYGWYENFHEHMEKLTPIDMTYDFLTRTGRIDEARLRRDYPQFLAYCAARGGRLAHSA